MNKIWKGRVGGSYVKFWVTVTPYHCHYNILVLVTIIQLTVLSRFSVQVSLLENR